MADISKPIYGEVWANAGERLLPPATKIENGWIQEMMPFQYENWIQHRQDAAIVYLFQKGVAEWSSEQEYIAEKSVVTYMGNLYIASITNTNVVPTMTGSWRRLNTNSSPDGVVTIAGGGTGATSVSGARTNLGLGTVATQNANSIAITGGTLTSITAAGAFTGNLSGNSSTATSLQTARTFAITGAATSDPVSFNGTANILLNVLSLDATKLVGVSSVNSTGNSATATVLQTPRTIAVTGAATGTPTSFNGSADISIPIVSLNATDLLTGTVPLGRLGNAVTKTSNTGSAQLPVGTTGQRDSNPVAGSIRLNTTNNNLLEYWNGTSWIVSNGTDLGGLIGTAGYQISTNTMNDLKYQSLTAAAAMSVADRDRTNHTGVQAISTVEGLQANLTSIETNVANLELEKQEVLVSTENIKTINGVSILGSGNIITSSMPIGSVHLGFAKPVTDTWLDVEKVYLKSSYPELSALLGTYSDGSYLATQRNFSTAQASKSVAYGNGVVVAVGEAQSAGAINFIQRSTDNGVTWSTVTNPGGTTQVIWSDVIYGGGVFVAVGRIATSSTVIMTSEDGLTWVRYSVTYQGQTPAIAYGGGKYVITSGASLLISSNATTWEVKTFPYSILSPSMAYGNSIFVIVGRISAVHGYAISTDGETWQWTPFISGITAPTTKAFTFGGGLFVGLTATDSIVSSDGRNWIKTPHSLGTFQNISYGAGTYLAVGGSNVSAISLDGMSWVNRTLPVSTTWNSVTFGNNTFVAVSQGPAGASSITTVAATVNLIGYDASTQFYIPRPLNSYGPGKQWIRAL